MCTCVCICVCLHVFVNVHMCAGVKFRKDSDILGARVTGGCELLDGRLKMFLFYFYLVEISIFYLFLKCISSLCF